MDTLRGDMSGVRDLYEFLVEAELQHYYTGLKNDLKVQNVPQLKYVEDEDLQDLGMTKPEMRRLKKFFRKECPQGTFSKLKRMIVTSGKESNGVPTATSSSQSAPSTQKQYNSRYIIQEEAITAMKTLGTGEFGSVQQGVWTTEDGERVQVAIKCVTPERMQTGRSDFLKEATIMHTIEHDNVVRLYGVVLGQDSLMLVTELAPLRSLLECLKDTSLRPAFTVSRLCDFAVQICDGMSYLENKRMIHRDLAARNVLVFAKDKVKISDFGLSRALGAGADYYQTNFNVNLKLPIAWCAPECISHLRFTSASDVWAYGVTLWEMFTYGFQPWAGFNGQQSKNNGDWKFANQILEAIEEPDGQRLEQPDLCPIRIYALMLTCWQYEPEDRPTFSELLGRISTLRPERLQAVRGAKTDSTEYLSYNTGDVITVLDDEPADAPELGLARGVLDSGKSGFYTKADFSAFIEVKTVSSPAMLKSRTSKLSRKESARKSQKPGVRKLDISMISGPADDLRHTGHIGYDGAVFGDVSFIAESNMPLPVKSTNAATRSNGSITGSAVSLPKSESDGGDSFVTSQVREPSPASVRMIQSYTAAAPSTRIETTQPISMQNTKQDTKQDTGQQEDDDLDTFTFKMPDMSMSDTFDLGPSLMDEVMKAWSTNEPREPDAGSTGNGSDTAPSDDKSPLIEREPSFVNGQTSFDNIALSTNDTDSIGDDCGRNGVSNGFGNGNLRDSGSSMGSQGSSLEMTSSMGFGSDSKKKSRKPKLKIDDEEPEADEFIPGGGGGGRSQRTGVRSLSESEEKKMDDAIKLANAYAAQSTNHMVSSPGPKTPSPKSQDSFSDHSHGGDSDCNSSMNSLKLRALLSSKKKKKSPKQEKKTYSEEIANISDVAEVVTPEAQEAYNMLIVRGSLKDKDGLRRREQRVQRSQEHEHQISSSPPAQPAASPIPPERPLFTRTSTHSSSQNSHHTVTTSSVSSHGGAVPFTARNTRNLNMNIREPKGIPHARASFTPSTRDTNASPEVDINPLRRLRESSNIIPMRSQSARISSDRSTTKPGPKTAPKPVLNANTSFFDKLKEQEAESSQESRQESSLDSGEGSEEGSINSIPLPPRIARSSLTNNNKTPRQRKYPLDLSQYNTSTCTSQEQPQQQSSHSKRNTTSSSSFKPRALPPDPESDGEDLNMSRDSVDSVFSLSSQNSSLEQHVPRDTQLSSYRLPPSPTLSASQFSVKSVKLTAKDLGYLDTTDLFWCKDMALHELGSSSTGSQDSDEGMGHGHHAPIPGRYKTSDTVSYEDLLEFALDGVSERECDLDICDEVRLMRRVLTKDVTIEDCMYALEDTQWDVHAAVKLVKLKQLLSTKLAQLDRCKEVLMQCHWQVTEAADYLLRCSSGQNSPELVHV